MHMRATPLGLLIVLAGCSATLSRGEGGDAGERAHAAADTGALAPLHERGPRELGTTDSPSREAASREGAPPAPTEINLLLRGQSNAYMFLDDGGAGTLAGNLEQKLGVKVRLLADYGVDDGSSTIYSGTAFMDWAKDGEQQGLLSYLKEQAADVLDDPTITIWMHNEYDQGNDSLTTAEWLAAVKSDAALVRAALGQGPSTTPYHFVWIPYGFGSAAIDEIKAGMAQLAADPSFNATISKATDSDIAMDAGPVPGAHLGAADGALIAARLTAELEPIAKALAGGGKP